MDTTRDKDNSSSKRSNVSFKFTKHSAAKLTGNKLQEKDDRESILAVEHKKIKSLVPKEKKKPLVVQPIEKNVWRTSHKEKVSKTFSTPSDSIRDLAIKELLEESAKENEKWERRESNNLPNIPMVIQNKIPSGFETDEKLNVDLRAEESTLENYEQIPIDEFGAAVLRGLGCNPGDPMGNKNKQIVKPIEAVPRSKGLGLGADKKPMQNKSSDHSKEELKFVAGAYIHVTQGQYSGAYGQVEGLDESRVIVKLDKESKNISLPILYVELISKKEYQKESKVINKKSYEKYKSEQESKNSNQRSTDDFSLVDGISSRITDRSSNGAADAFSKSHKRSRHEEEMNRKEERSERSDWICPLLRVRMVDNQYKNGKYYKQKVTVEDVLGHDNCVCRTEDGKYLEDISSKMLETVIPRSEPGYVMVVDGRYRGQLGIILNRDRTNCIAAVQFLSDREKVKKLSYDSICEYVGDVSQFD